MSENPKIEIKKIEDLTPDTNNANKGTERGLWLLDDSLSDVGLGRSILTDKHGNIIAGNKTHERAADKGFEDAIVVHTTGDKLVVVQRDDLDLSDPDPNSRARQMAYLDNRVAEADLKWDAEVVNADINAGMELGGLFSPTELSTILADLLCDDDEIEQSEEPQYDVKDGDIWIIPSKHGGNHRLICASSLEEETKTRLLDSVTEYTFFADPYYDDDLIDELQTVWNWESAAFLVGGKQIRDTLNSVEKYHLGVLMGASYQPQMGNYNRLAYTHRIIIWTSPNALNFGVDYRSVITNEEPNTKKHGGIYHHHAKAPDAIATILRPFSEKVIIDAFAGAGSAFVAAECLGRLCYGVELESNHCAAILTRTFDLGLSPELEERVD